MSDSNCACCGAPLVKVVIFCRECFFEAPPEDRNGLIRLYRQSNDAAVKTKTAKMVRAITEKRKRNKERAEAKQRRAWVIETAHQLSRAHRGQVTPEEAQEWAEDLAVTGYDTSPRLTPAQAVALKSNSQPL